MTTKTGKIVKEDSWRYILCIYLTMGYYLEKLLNNKASKNTILGSTKINQWIYF